VKYYYNLKPAQNENYTVKKNKTVIYHQKYGSKLIGFTDSTHNLQ